jgi:hypothetical protein
MITRLVLAALFLWCGLAAAFAAPRNNILRHGEKADDWKLCGVKLRGVGQERTDALAAN